MTEMPSVAAKLAKRLLIAGGLVAILLAIGVGVLRLVFAQLPGYGEELTAWIADELGLVVGYERIDVRFGLRGPEISFSNATVAALGGEEPFLAARRVAATIDPWLLATAREGFVTRLALEGTQMTIARSRDGRYEIQGAPLAANSDRLLAKLPERVELALSEASLVYRDRASGESWEFTDVELGLARAPGSIELEAHAAPPGPLGRRLELAFAGAVTGATTALERWRLELDLRETDLAALAPLVPVAGLPAIAGRGDVSIGLETGPRGIARASARLALSNVALPELAAGADWTYERLGLEAAWARGAGDAWTLELDDVALVRGGRAWAAGGDSALHRGVGEDGRRFWTLASDFLRLEDLRPLLLLLPPSESLRRWLEADVRGDLYGVDLRLARRDGTLEYDVSAEFRGVGFDGSGAAPNLDGLSGELRADARSGRIRLQSPSLELDWPQLFRERLSLTGIHGVVVWRQGRDVLRVVSDDLAFAALGGEARSSLELTFPSGGGSPRADVEATLSRADVLAARQWLPAPVMPASVVEWLDAALAGGTLRDVTFELYGLLEALPFDAGEGQLRVAADVADAELEFVDGWPAAVELDGRVEFVNAGFAARGRGRVLGNRTRALEVRIDDLREAVLRLTTTTEGPLVDVLAFLKTAPLIARELGPELARLRVHEGRGRVDLDLELPLRSLSAYDLAAGLAVEDGDLSVDGFAPHVSEVSGRLVLEGRTLSSRDLEAVLLGAPVTLGIETPEARGYRSLLRVDGETALDAVRRQFDLPFAARVAGQTRWRGELWIPAPAAAPRPLRVRVESNLAGVALRFPAPLEKAPGEPLNLNLELELGGAGLAVDGNLGASRRFALRYGPGGEPFAGAVRFGGDPPVLPEAGGLTVSGTLPRLDLDEWVGIARSLVALGGGALLDAADLEVGELSVLGQELGSSRFAVSREPDLWRIRLDSEAAAGTIDVPRGAPPGRPQIEAEMQRLYLATGPGRGRDGAAATLDAVDPRELPGLTLHADEFGLGTRRLGALDAEIRPDPLGLRLVSFASRNGEMHIDASGSWLTGVDGPRTRLALNLSSTQVSSTLEKLGFDPVVEGELADVTASIEWPGRPSSSWVDHVEGRLALRVERGSLLEVEPGAGRVVGLMSILALPRRLALDFRDVFNKGFVFDEIRADFLILDGEAYTDNLKLTGPAAEIGVAGRTGLRERDYEQQALVTAEPGNMLPTVGGLIGGPGVGAALLIFTRIFKEPLKGIGRASYCISGTWDAPEVERLTPAELERGEICADLPPEGAAAQAGLEPATP